MADCVTDSQDEQNIEDLLRDADQIHIPIFQRAYVWKKSQFDELLTDIEQVVSEIEDTQFLGAIVAYEMPRTGTAAGRLKALAVVDGQQRLLTLNLYIMAIVECLAAVDKEEAFEIVRAYLLLAPRKGLEINTRVVPAFVDRSQFRLIWDRLNRPEVLQEQLKDLQPHLPPPSGPSNGALVDQYARIFKHLRSEAPENKIEKVKYLGSRLEVVTQHLTFVHLKLNDASAATKIFERLNFRGVKVGIVDLVRNEIFSSLAEDPVEAHRIFDHVWRPFEDEFVDRAEFFFFPYCLTLDSNTKKSELFVQLRTSWKGLSPEEMINHMKPLQGPFLSIDKTGYIEKSKEISKRLDRLVRMKRPSSVYPFVMSMLHAFIKNCISEKEVSDLLDVLEAFLVRRAIVGIEPTGLHALFKGLWSQLSNYTASEFKRQIKARPTIQWPSDLEVCAAIEKRPLAKTNICSYLLVEFDRAIKGDDPREAPTIEHVLPQSYDESSDWATLFTREQHKQLKDTWANIVPLSAPINSSLQAAEYLKKKPRYQKESMFKTPRLFAETYSEWSPQTIQERTKELADWALSRWRDVK